MDPAVVRAIEELRGLNVAALKTRYLAVFGEEAKSSNKQFLFRRIAWRLQAQVEGDLSERARRRAAEIASDADLRTRAPKGFLPGNAPGNVPWVTDRSQPQRDWRLPAPGSLLTRRLDDRQIVVKVLEEGFEYDPALPVTERNRARGHRYALEWAVVFWLCGAPGCVTT